MTEPSTIVEIASPQGPATGYKYFLNNATGTKWKAKLTINAARETMVMSEDVLAPAEYSATISVAPTDDAGLALRDGDLPIVLDSITHTFTVFELSQPDFDAHARIMLILEQQIRDGEGRVAKIASIKSMATSWGS